MAATPTDWRTIVTSVLVGGSVFTLLGNIYSTKTTRSFSLRSVRQDAYLKFASQALIGRRIAEEKIYVMTQIDTNEVDDDEIGTNEVDDDEIVYDEIDYKEPNPKVLDRLNADFNKWLDTMDEPLVKFAMSSPNYVSHLGDLYYWTIWHSFDGKISKKLYSKRYQRFYNAARFDLRHPIWSYFRSILFFFFFQSIQWFALSCRKMITWILSWNAAKRLGSRKFIVWAKRWRWLKRLGSRKLFKWIRRIYRESIERDVQGDMYIKLEKGIKPFPS